MPAFVEDVQVYPTMIGLVAKAEDELRRRGLSGVAWAGVITGTEADLDCGTGKNCGAMWCRLDNAVVTRDFPTAYTSADACATTGAFTLELGIMRCTNPFIDTRGAMMSVSSSQDDVRTALADMAAMQAVITCGNDFDVAINGYQPLITGGGCFGGYWNFTVGTAA